MQYLLTEEEMAEFVALRSERTSAPGRESLKNVAKHMACEMIDLNPPNGAPKLDRPHGCIHVADARGPGWQTRYCDRCPAQGICPMPKEWSK